MRKDLGKILTKFLSDREYRFELLTAKGVFNFLPDKIFIEQKYKIKMGKKLNLQNPRTYNEKLQWLKLYDRNPLYTTLVDKYAVKDFVAEKIGEKYIIPTLGVWNSFEEIDFDSLPEKFVLKCTHDSGGIVICTDKKNLNMKHAEKKIKRSLKRNFYWAGREWPYKNVVPRIIAEQYMEDSKTKELRDYKFFVFDGKVKMLFIASERQAENEETKFDFFDEEFNYLDIRNGHPNAVVRPSKPERFEEMKVLAEKLAEGLCEARVDFYEVDGQIYFGEITFFHHGGWTPFEPYEWDVKFGEYIKLRGL